MSPLLTQSRDGTVRVDFNKGYSSVIIPTKDNKFTLCLSCQVGCAMNCSFCYSNEFQENLSGEEIIRQFETCFVQFPITSVVFMGMGEPTANFDSVTQAIEHMHAAHNLAYDRITLSTIGRKLDLLVNVPYMVAVSLHSPDEEIRQKMVPFGSRVADIVAFAIQRKKERNKNTMIEYALIDGVNDRDSDMQKLMSYDWPEDTHFNLIEFNPKDDYLPSERLDEWKAFIREKGYKCFIRMARGRDIGAACGMLNAV